MSRGHGRAAALLLAILGLASLAVPALAATYTITVSTDQPSYSGLQHITISGVVSPAPGPNTGVIVTVKAPNGAGVDFGSESVDATTGAWQHVTVPGGTGNWTSGTYTVNATWGGHGTSASAVTTFVYSLTTSTSSTSTTTSTTTTTTSTSPSSSSSSSTTSSTTSSSSTSTTTTTTSTTTSTTGSVSTSSSSESTVTQTVTVGQSSTTSSTGSTSQTTTSPPGGGLGSLTYVIAGAVVVVIAVAGLMIWRRKVAREYGQPSPTTP